MKQRMLCLLLTLALLCAFLPQTALVAHAEVFSGQCGEYGDNLSWMLDTVSGLLTVSGTGTMEDYAAGEAPWYAQRDRIQGVVLGSGIEAVGTHAFDGCTKLNAVDFPQSLRRIGADAFTGTALLTKFDGDICYASRWVLGARVTIGTAQLPADCVGIADGAFSDCTDLTALTLPEGLRRIGAAAFQGCTKLGTVALPADLESVGAMAFANTALESDATNWRASVAAEDAEADQAEESELLIVDGWLLRAKPEAETLAPDDTVFAIADGAFSECTKLRQIRLPETLSRLGADCFRGCAELTQMQLPAALSHLGSSAFLGCTALGGFTVAEENETFTAVDSLLLSKDLHTLICCPAGYTGACVMPADVTTVLPYAFSGCGKLTSLTCAEDLNLLGVSAFSGCTELTELTLPDGVSRIPARCFDDCEGLKTLRLYDSVRWIEADALRNCAALENVALVEGESEMANTLPNNLLRLSDRAFSGCESLKTLTLPDSLTELGTGVFSGCTGLERIAIPNRITGIPSKCFTDCTALASVRFGSGIRTVAEDAFQGCTGLTEYAVAATNDTYSADGGALLNKAKTTLLRYPLARRGAYTVPATVTAISAGAFSGCTALSAITLHDRLTSLGTDAFSGCTGLVSVALPNGIATVPEGCFADCTALQSVAFGSGVRTIGKESFRNCTAIRTLVIPQTVTSIEKDAFLQKSATRAGTDASATVRMILLNDNISIADSETTLGVPSKTVLHANASSKVQTYAAKYKYTFEQHAWSTWTDTATCTANGTRSRSCSICRAIESASTKATGHDWGEPSYTWSNDYASVTATRVCKNDKTHVESETVKTTSKINKAATCTVKGETVYTTESFKNTAFKQQTKTVETPVIAHSYKDGVCTMCGAKEPKSDTPHTGLIEAPLREAPISRLLAYISAWRMQKAYASSRETA